MHKKDMGELSGTKGVRTESGSLPNNCHIHRVRPAHTDDTNRLILLVLIVWQLFAS